MPSDAVALMEGPSAALLWVLAGGLQPEVAYEDYGFKWHEATRRVLLPLSQGILGRAVHGERPKYRLSGQSSTYRPPGTASNRPQRPLVVVEDVLSAIAIQRAGWPALALLGTSVSPEQVAACAAPRVIAWFDADKAGNAAWVRLRKGLALYPTQLTRITTEQDPKRLFRATLIEHLEAHT